MPGYLSLRVYFTPMAQYIESVSVTLLSGKFKETIRFSNGLNILSGENGTMKTRLFKAIAGSTAINGQLTMRPAAPRPVSSESDGLATVQLAEKDTAIRAQFISPKRNSEKRTIETIRQRLMSAGPAMPGTENLFSSIDDNTYKTYPSIGELFYKQFNELNKGGENQKDNMQTVRDEYNQIITQVFPNYTISVDWNSALGQPEATIDKGHKGKVPLDGLSSGEQEVLSLVLNLHDLKDKADVILIDEPEIHLNWHLEEKLFRYFLDFCNSYSKQLIIISHSRVIFYEDFVKVTQFLYWNKSGDIKLSSEPSDELKQLLAGEVIEIVKMGSLAKPSFFVEDTMHVLVLKILAQKAKVDIYTSACGNSSNVKSFYKLSEEVGGWGNSYFLIDGDNQGNPFPNAKNFIHLDKYCIQNYFLDFQLASKVLKKTEDEVRQILFGAIIKNKERILGNNKYLEFLVDRLQATDITADLLAKFDGSVIFPSLAEMVPGNKHEEYIRKYIDAAEGDGRLWEVLPKSLQFLFEEKDDPK